MAPETHRWHGFLFGWLIISKHWYWMERVLWCRGNIRGPTRNYSCITDVLNYISTTLIGDQLNHPPVCIWLSVIQGRFRTPEGPRTDMQVDRSSTSGLQCNKIPRVICEKKTQPLRLPHTMEEQRLQHATHQLYIGVELADNLISGPHLLQDDHPGTKRGWLLPEHHGWRI